MWRNQGAERWWMQKRNEEYGFKMVPDDGPHLLVFVSLCNTLHLSVSGTYDLLSINSIWLDIMSVSELDKITTFALLAGSLLLVWWGKLPCWRGPLSETLRKSPANSHQEFRPSISHHPTEINSINGHKSKFSNGSFCSQGRLQMRPQNWSIPWSWSHERPWQVDPANSPPDS